MVDGSFLLWHYWFLDFAFSIFCPYIGTLNLINLFLYSVKFKVTYSNDSLHRTICCGSWKWYSDLFHGIDNDLYVFSTFLSHFSSDCSDNANFNLSQSWQCWECCLQHREVHSWHRQYSCTCLWVWLPVIFRHAYIKRWRDANGNVAHS